MVNLANKGKKRSKLPKEKPKTHELLSRFFPSPKVIPAVPSSVANQRKPPTTLTKQSKPMDPPAASEPSSVYILELEQARVYVGSSKNVQRGAEQHILGTGAAYMRTYKPTGVMLPRLGNVVGNRDAVEWDETLRYMMLREVSYVRGWKFSQATLTKQGPTYWSSLICASGAGTTDTL